VALRAVVAIALAAALPSAGLAQEAADRKLDPLARALSATLLGRSRAIVEFRGTPDVRVITRHGGRALLRRPGQLVQVAEIENRRLATLAADPQVARITIDRPVFATMARTGPTVGSTIAREHFGLTGAGVGIALVDSGITSWHNDLFLPDASGRRRLADFKDFTGEGLTGSADAPTDGYGHGTHVGGILVGSGHDSDGARSGIAPGAHLVVLKVLDSNGHGFISDVIAAIEYAIANKDAHNIRIINLSVATFAFESAYDDPLARAARRAVDAGIVVVAAAGNLGTNERGEIQHGGITSPGMAPWVLTVGAASHQGTRVRSDDAVAPFSSRGPTPVDFAAKPDLVAPGVGIEAPADPGSTLALQHPELLLDGSYDARDKPYLSLSGTSMAAPVVTGVVAQVLEANPSLTPNAVKGLLQFTAQVIEGEPYLAQGAGLVNAVGAVRLARFWTDMEQGLGPASDVIEGEQVLWSQHLLWGNYRVTGGVPLPGANAWTTSLTWGAMQGPGRMPVVWGARTLNEAFATGGRDNIVWATGGRDNIVWATGGRDNIVWATGGRDNIVWATGGRDNIVWATGGRDNIVWATGGRENIVWATGGRDNIVWATGGRDNIVWATGGRENIVWATGGRDNIVWATAIAENLVWGNDCDGLNCTGVAWGAEQDGMVWGTARSFGNIVWATGGRDNIVWATGGRDNIVWATSTVTDVVWPADTPREGETR
jgi:serine protease AprX